MEIYFHAAISIRGHHAHAGFGNGIWKPFGAAAGDDPLECFGHCNAAVQIFARHGPNALSVALRIGN